MKGIHGKRDKLVAKDSCLTPHVIWWSKNETLSQKSPRSSGQETRRWKQAGNSFHLSTALIWPRKTRTAKLAWLQQNGQVTDNPDRSPSERPMCIWGWSWTHFGSRFRRKKNERRKKEWSSCFTVGSKITIIPELNIIFFFPFYRWKDWARNSENKYFINIQLASSRIGNLSQEVWCHILPRVPLSGKGSSHLRM